MSPSGRCYWGLGGMWLQLSLKPCSHSNLCKEPLSFLLLSAGNSLFSGTPLMGLQRNIPQLSGCTSPRKPARPRGGLPLRDQRRAGPCLTPCAGCTPSRPAIATSIGRPSDTSILNMCCPFPLNLAHKPALLVHCAMWVFR